MRINILLAALCTIMAMPVYAQKALHSYYHWEDAPAIHPVSDSLSSFPAVFVLHNRFHEVRLEKDGAYSYFTEHRIIHVNSAAGIEQFNKVYIPMSGERKIEVLQVRSITPQGKIVNLKKENLKELSNVEGYGAFKIFAIEGLEVDGELEYIYTVKSRPQSYGREVFQREVPVLDALYELIYPDRFAFTVKSYNGLPSPATTAPYDRRMSTLVRAKNIPALAEEEYSAHKASLMRVDFKLQETPASKSVFTWASLSESILKNFYAPKVKSGVEKMLKPLIEAGYSEEQKIHAVEKYIKTNFSLKKGNNEAYEDPKEILGSRVANERGIIKIYLACWDVLDIKAEVVLAPNRYQGSIDPQMPSPLDLDETLFFFPSIEKYLAPDVTYMRCGPAPQTISNGYGLFINYYIDENQIHYSKHDIRRIEPLQHTHNKMGVRANVLLSDLNVPEIEEEYYCQGLRAAQYRGYYYLLPEEEKKKFLKENVFSAIDNPTVEKFEVTGEDVNLSFNVDNFFYVKTHYRAPSLVELAGEDYLLSVGKIIGKQSELYQEQERRTDVAFHATSNYEHEIVVNIPAGYEVQGLDGINIDNSVMEGGNALMQFKSGYTLENDQLKIKVSEFYKVLHLPRSRYEDFRKVVNSAADFNKVVLILHPVAK